MKEKPYSCYIIYMKLIIIILQLHFGEQYCLHVIWLKEVSLVSKLANELVGFI